MPEIESTPPGDREPAPARTPTPPRQSLVDRLRATETETARARAAKAALADGMDRARAREKAACAAFSTTGHYIGGSAHKLMPAVVPILDLDSVRDPDEPAFELNFDDGVMLFDVEPVWVAGAPRKPGDLMHSIVETMANSTMEALYRKGWLPIPQKRSGGKRGPEGGITYKEFRKNVPTLPMIRSWANQHPSSNVALLMGSVSYNVFALDLDIYRDHPRYLEIAEALREHLGFDFARFGQKGFVQLLRAPEGVVIRNRTYMFACLPGEDESPGALEIIGNGLVTAYGHHHKTGDYFKWTGSMPLLYSPLSVPVVTVEQIDAAIAAVGAILPFAGSKGSGSRGCPVDPDGIVAYDSLPEVPGAVMPRVDLADPRWTSDGEKITDGRRRFMLSHSFALVCGNGFKILGDATDKQWRGLIAPALAAVLAVVRTDGKRDEASIRDYYTNTIETTVARLRDGTLKPWVLHAAPDGSRVKPGRLRLAADAAVRDVALSWLGKPAAVASVADMKKTTAIRPTVVIPATDDKRAARNLDVDRAIERARIGAKTDAALDDFIISALAGENAVHLLDAPTGGGKTTRTLAKVLPALTQRDDERPLLFLMPTLDNLAEAAEIAKRDGAYFETGDAEQKLMAKMMERAEALGLSAVIWKSKAAAGCRMLAVAEMLNAAGIGTTNLCRARSKVPGPDGEKKWDECKHMEECSGDGYQAVKIKSKTAKIIFASHYWLTAPVLPEELKECRAIVIDESILFRVASTGWLPRSAFDLSRPIPSITQLDRKLMRIEGGSRMPESAVHDRWAAETVATREYAAGIAQHGIDQRWDLTRLASEFAEDARGVDAVRMQVRILTDAMSYGSKVRPNIPTPEIARLVEHARPRFLALERRFWVTVLQLTLQIRADADPARKANAPFAARRNADGTLRRDTRLQAIQQVGASGLPEWGYRISWRATINWASAPTLMLDASADKDIVKRLYPGREVVHHHVPPGLLNLRTVLIADATYSGSSLDPRPQGDDGDEARALAAAEKCVKLRKLLELAATSHGHGRMLFGGSKKVRELIMGTWTWPPENIDEVHYGAQRGLDFAKNHLCAVSIGRSEMPIWLVDGLAAALTWDTDEPEEPYDERGDGLRDDGKPLMRLGVTRMVQCRDGADVGLSVPMVPGTYGRKIDTQWRDEELSQFRGRLRPVYRDEPATWICVSSVFPEGIVADAILTLDEAISTWSPIMSAQAVRGVGGVVAVGVTDRLDAISTTQVERFIADHADDPAYRDVTYSTMEGDIRFGLVSALQDPEPVFDAMIGDVHVSVGPPKARLAPSKAREPDAVILARPSAEERERRAEAWHWWFVERRAAGDEAVQHGKAISIMLRHREDPPGYVPQETAVEPVPDLVRPKPIVVEAGLSDDFLDLSKWVGRPLNGPPRMAAE